MDTQENNRLIAEFIGLQTGSQLGKDRWPNDWFDNEGVINGHRNTYLHFNTSWDWLIPVIEKCRERQIFGAQRLISNIDKRLLTLDLLSTYQNVVEFIQWYNLNQVKPQLKEQTT